MAVTIKRIGYAQVEPNHLSAPRDGHVYGQLPAASAIEVLEQGQYVYYDKAAGEVNFTGNGPLMMVFNEEKLYDERHQMHRDYAQKVSDSYDGKIYPRVFRVSAGDLYTTNALNEASYAVGDELCIDHTTGFLKKGDAALGEPGFIVVKETTMPDMQPAVQVQVVTA